MSKKAELIFMKWKADLAEMDRSKPSIEGNFDLLFSQMQQVKVKLDDALPFLDKAITAHYPTSYVVKQVFRRIKHYGKSETLQDFESTWKELIGNGAKRVFFSLYDIDGTDATPKEYGSMSASEYNKQQKYADSHPTIDWEAIVAEQEKEVIDDKGLEINADNVNLDIDLGDL